MPFTLSHPAIVLPLAIKKLRLSATGLIIGSITPDFEYFIRMRDWSRYSHTWSGFFWFDLPVGVILCFIYHLLVRNSLFDNLPVFLKQRVIIYKKFNWIEYFKKNWIIVCISVLIGVLSHILWDAFTHESQLIVQKDPELSALMKVGSINLAGYKFLQLASSLAGLAIIIAAFFSLKKHPCPDKKIDYKYWAIVVLIIVVIMFMRLIKGIHYDFLRRIIIAAITSTILALILTPMILAQLKQNYPEFSEEKTER
jgi:hypothetical protein